jgi:hypothetical protein
MDRHSLYFRLSVAWVAIMIGSVALVLFML